MSALKTKPQAFAGARRGGLPPLTAEIALSRFDKLPDSAGVPLKTGCAVLSLSETTFVRKSQSDPRLRPIRINARVLRYSVGGIRSILRGEGAPE